MEKAEGLTDWTEHNRRHARSREGWLALWPVAAWLCLALQSAELWDVNWLPALFLFALFGMVTAGPAALQRVSWWRLGSAFASIAAPALAIAWWGWSPLLGWFAWFAAGYLALGALVTLAFVFVARNQASSGGPARAEDRRHYFLTLLKVFALWPWVLLMGAVFAIIMVAQKHGR